MLAIYIQNYMKRIEHYERVGFIQGIQGQFNKVMGMCLM